MTGPKDNPTKNKCKTKRPPTRKTHHTYIVRTQRRELENTSLSPPLALTKELTNQFGNVTRVARIVVGKIEAHIDSINETNFENQNSNGRGP